jgi:hypothetical protein
VALPDPSEAHDFAYAAKFQGSPMIQPEIPVPFEDNLTAALRIAHGLRIRLELRLESGGFGGLELTARGSAGGRWFERVLVPSYPRGRWSTIRPPGVRPNGSVVATAEPIGNLDQPFRSADDHPRWIDGWVRALLSEPPRFTVCARFCPIPSSATIPPLPSVPEIERGTVGPGNRLAPLPEVERKLRDRLHRRRRVLSWLAAIDLATSPGVGSSGSDHRSIASALETVARMEGGNGLRFRSSTRFRARSPRWFVISEDELRALLPSPYTPVRGGTSTRDAGSWSLWIGRTQMGTGISLPVEPHQGRHFALLGETGMGKSSLLVRVALRAAAVGGVLLLDPIGDTGRELLARLPLETHDRVSWVSPVDSPLGLNALEGARLDGAQDPAALDRRIGDLVTALKRVRAVRYVDQPFWGPRIEEMLFRSLRAAALYPDGSLEDAHQLLESADRSPHGIPEMAREAVLALHQRVRDRPDELEGSRRVLHEIVRSPALHSLLCRRAASWRAAAMVAPRAIVVVTGDAAQVGELTSRYLLSVYLGLLWSEILGRPKAGKLFVLLDEVQWFAHESLADLLRLGRRFNIHVGVATQALRSLPESVQESIWTNCSDYIVFRGAPGEAREFARWLPALEPAELLSLPRGNAIVFLGKGSTVEWMRTDPLAGAPPNSLGRFKFREGTAAPAPGESPPAPSPKPEIGPIQEADKALGPASIRRVFAWIAACLERSGADTEILVALDDLRAATDPSGEILRRVGSTLGRTGAIRTQRDPRGRPMWQVRPALFRASVDPPLSTNELEWGRQRQAEMEGP